MKTIPRVISVLGGQSITKSVVCWDGHAIGFGQQDVTTLKIIIEFGHSENKLFSYVFELCYYLCVLLKFNKGIR